jgi:hypothetical protein
MKTILSYTNTGVIIHLENGDHPYKRRGAMLLLSETDTDGMPEPLALILTLLSGARKYYIPKETYFEIREKVWTYLDRCAGGLNEAGLAQFQNDADVLEASALHKAAIKTSAKNIEQGGK